MQLFIPAKNKKQAAREAPPWACRFARAQGGFMVFDSEPALHRWTRQRTSSRPATLTAHQRRDGLKALADATVSQADSARGRLLRPRLLSRNEIRMSTKPNQKTFTVAKNEFDRAHVKSQTAKCIVPVNGRVRESASIKDKSGKPSEEYYKRQFVHALITSGLYARDFVGVEVQFPKGNSAVLRLDGAIFDSGEWLEHYNAYWKNRRSTDLEWLNDHLLAVIEFKKNDKDIEKVFTGQVKPAMREREPANAYVLGVYYGADRLYLFQRRTGNYLRYDESKNQKGDDSKVGDLSLHLPDPYGYLPDFDDLRKRVNRPTALDRSQRTIKDLDVITTIASVQIKTALSDVLRALDKVNLVDDQRGYGIFLQAFALKVFDEKRNEKRPHRVLDFHVSDAEAAFHALSDAPVKGFIKRIHTLRDEAAGEYQQIFGTNVIDWRDSNDVRAVVAIAKAFQDYSFVLSAKSDLYQLVFYNFANSFKRDEAAQFLTPLPVIDFIVRLLQRAAQLRQSTRRRLRTCNLLTATSCSQRILMWVSVQW